MKRVLYPALGLVTVCALLFVVGFRHSSPPSEWRGIAPGMPRAEVLSLLPTGVLDQRQAKGFDMAKTRRTHRLGASGYWMLVLSYDSSDHLAHARTEFVCDGNDTSNPFWPPQLLYRINKGSIREME